MLHAVSTTETAFERTVLERSRQAARDATVTWSTSGRDCRKMWVGVQISWLIGKISQRKALHLYCYLYTVVLDEKQCGNRFIISSTLVDPTRGMQPVNLQVTSESKLQLFPHME